MALTYKSTVPIASIAVPLFSLFLAIGLELSLQLSALISLSLSLGISLVLPTIALGISVAINLILQFNLALAFTLPDFTLNLSLALSFELALVLGFTATLELLLNAIAGVNLCAYGWFGPGVDMGTYVGNAVGAGWPDGTSSADPITAVLFVATTSGATPADQVAALTLTPAPAPPPVPTTPPPPAGTPWPPTQAYEAGICTVTLSAPPPGGTQATATVSVDSSVAPGIGAVTGFTVVDKGSGYTTAPTVTLSDSCAIVSASSVTPIVLTLPSALTIPAASGFGITVAGVLGSTVILDAVQGPTDTPALLAAAKAASAAATTPDPAAAQAAATAAAAAQGTITITVASTAGLVTASIPPGTYGLEGLNGTWFCKVTGPTTAELWSDALFTQPAQGSGTYTPSSARLAANICGQRTAKVLTPTTVALYTDQAMTIPVAGLGVYSGGTVTGGGSGAAATVTMGGGATNALQSLINGLPWPKTEGLAGGVIEFKVMISALFDLMTLLLGNLKARASLLGSASASVGLTPPTIAASLQFLAAISANLAANLSVKLPSLSASASAALSAQIQALASISAQIGFFLGLTPAGLGLELEIYEYTGPGAGLGPAIAAGPGALGWHDGTGVNVPVTAGVFGLTTSASQAAFATFFAGA